MTRISDRHWISNQFERVHQKLDRLIHKSRNIYDKEVLQMAVLDDLEREVSELSTASDSAIALLQGLKAALDEAIATGDLNRVQAVVDQIDAKEKALAAAVVANTPSAPTP